MSQTPPGIGTEMFPETWQPFEVSIWSAQLSQFWCTVSKHAELSEQTGGSIIARNSVPASNSITTPEMDFPSLLECALFAGGAGKKVRESPGMVSVTISHKAGNAVEGSWCVESCIFWCCYITFSIILKCPLMHCNLLSNRNRKRGLKVKIPM